jgi:hypothetical protein
MLRILNAVGVSTVLVAGLSAVTLAAAREQPPGRAALVERFNQRVQAYVAMHRQVERFLPPQQIFTDPAEARRSMVGMANAMRALRPNAAEGDVFDTEIGNLFRDDLWHALRQAGINPETVAVEMVPEMPGEYEVPEVNGNFSWALANAMPPCVLRALPELPIELQYRFVQFDLVLVDLHANLIVDILRDALPAEDVKSVTDARQVRPSRSRYERFTQCD